MKAWSKLGWIGLGVVGVMSGCDGETQVDDTGTPRVDAFVEGADAFVPEVDAFVPEGVDAGIDAAALTPDAFVPADAFSGPDSAMSATDDCMRTGYPALSLVEVAPGHDWNRPVFLTHPPGSSDLYVVDARGFIYLVRDGAVLDTPFLDVSSMIGRLTGGVGDERGLLGLAFHPDYATNGRFFVGYTVPGDGENVVAEGHRSTASADQADPTLTPILTIADFAANHNGGMVAFGPDGYLYIGTGDGGGGGDPQRTSQDPDRLLGKMLRIDVDTTSGGMMYGIPSDNPFASTAGVRPEIWAFGYRNPWRFSFDRLTHDLFVGDVGQDLWEEIDFEPAGSGGHNYGWSDFEGTHDFAGATLRAGDTHTTPIYEYHHDSSTELVRGGISITGGYVYRGLAIPELRGAYVFGDYASADVVGFRFCGGAVQEPTRLDLGTAVSGLVSFGEDDAGEIYVVTFGSGSNVRRIVAR
ncbi:MAG: PQQ-dependent sugar dehydrogenase [Sandaracinaceae bacterium]|nr:PQQ-dependent sugar dehydrogenase [Sandaracinaceae bacterium]